MKNSKSRNNRAIKSLGRRYTISLLVNYTSNPELRSFYCSMLHPNNACRKYLILSFYRRKKKSSIRNNDYLQKICCSCKKMTNYEHIAMMKTTKQTEVASGLH